MSRIFLEVGVLGYWKESTISILGGFLGFSWAKRQREGAEGCERKAWKASKGKKVGFRAVRRIWEKDLGFCWWAAIERRTSPSKERGRR